jgi:predicted dehydrogenase
VAGIGIGGQGGSDIDAVAGEGHNLVALCDVDNNYAAKKFAQYPKARQFKDFRVMLDKMDREIDAVVIGTPDHSHAVIAMEAMKHRKHVYCEKPLTHTVHEVRELMKAATKYKVVTQLGNQGHSFGTIRRLCEWVWAGAIGQVHTVHASCDAFKDVYCQIRNLDIPAGRFFDAEDVEVRAKVACLTDKLAVGRVSNMYEIVEVLLATPVVLSPEGTGARTTSAGWNEP